MNLHSLTSHTVIPDELAGAVEHVPALDFDSDEPLPVCPLRNNGDDICESCQ